VVGLGYVGLSVAVSFGKKQRVIGFDINMRRIAELKAGVDNNGEVSSEELQKANIDYTPDAKKLGECDFIIVAVPTPIDNMKQPDATLLKKASRTVGKHLSRGTIVVYESTVYPGMTEEVCSPILEKSSGLLAGKDFFIGYSPERINPGDRKCTFETITKVVSGQNEEVLSIIAEVYGSVVKAGIYRAPSIRVAEAAKIIENTQRDVNIALMNELAIIFDKLKIETTEVLAAAKTKWNFLPFTPGLVGGHCIGVDPYYLAYKAESVGYRPEVILAGRRINDKMGNFIAHSIMKQMVRLGIGVQAATVTILGVTFKENVSDIRNSRVIDIVKELHEFGINVQVSDPKADADEVYKEYGIRLVPMDKLLPAHTVIIAVAHQEYVAITWKEISALLVNGGGLVADVKGVLKENNCPQDITLWRL